MSTPAAPAATPVVAPVTPTVTPVVTPAAPVTPPAAPSATPTAQRVAGAFFKSFGLEEPKAPATPPPAPAAPAPAAPAVNPPAATPPVEPPKEELKAPKELKPKKEKLEVGEPGAPTPPRRRAEDLNIRDIVKESVAGAIEGMKPKAPEAPKIELSPGIARKVEALKVLEKEEPRFKGVSKSVEEFYRVGGAEERYKADWQKANPGKKFNREDDTHDEWYAENDPLASKVTEDDLELARDLLIEQRATEKADRRLATIEQQRVQQEQKTTVITRAKQALDELAMESIAAFSPELAEKAKTPEKLATLDKDDPLAEHLLMQSVQRVAPLVEAVVEIFGTSKFDEKNPVHIQVDTLGGELEAQLLAMGDQANREGKPYLAMQEYERLPATQKKSFWTIGEKDLLKFIKLKEKNQTVAMYQRLRPTVVTNTAPAAAAPVATPVPAPAAPAVSSPSVSSAPSAPPPGTPVSSAPSRTAGAFFSSWGVK